MAEPKSGIGMGSGTTAVEMLVSSKRVSIEKPSDTELLRRLSKVWNSDRSDQNQNGVGV